MELNNGDISEMLLLLKLILINFGYSLLLNIFISEILFCDKSKFIKLLVKILPNKLKYPESIPQFRKIIFCKLVKLKLYNNNSIIVLLIFFYL